MLHKEVLDALNKQIQQELTAGYGYLVVSAYFELELLKGFAAYFRKQADEERDHAMRFLTYVQDRNARPSFGAVEPPKTQFSSPLEAVRFALESERKNTASIHALHALAGSHHDLATQSELQWFINEQVEEEKWAEEFVGLVEKAAGHTGALFMLDHHVGKRVTKE
jgi:ferritin